MPVAEIKIRTTHDGTQAERSLDKLGKQVEKLGSTIGSRASAAMAGLFSVEKIVSFARSVDETVSSVGKLVEKLKEGKITLDDVKKESGLVAGNTGSLAGIDASRSEQPGIWKNTKALAARAWYLMGATAQVQAVTGDPKADEKAAYAIYGDLGTLTSAEMQGKVANQKARNEARRQQAIKELIDREMSGPEGGGQGFNPVTGRYFGPGLPSAATQQAHRSIELERQSLDELRRISNILDRGPSTNSGTAFPQ